MRVPRREIPTQPITFLWERHQEIARRLVAGERPIDIARSMNMTPTRISIIMNSPIFKQQLAKLSSRADESAVNIQERLKEESRNAIDYLSKVLKGDANEAGGNCSPALRSSVAKDILDRAGHGKIQKIHQVNENIILTGDRIEELKRKRQEMLKGIKVIDLIPQEA
jgi:hypothetical protein